MQFLLNITFVMSTQDEARATLFLRSHVLPTLEAAPAQYPRLVKVRSSEGEARSLAFEVGFDSLSQVRSWRTEHMEPALKEMSLTWGERLMYFDTLLEILPLK